MNTYSASLKLAVDGNLELLEKFGDAVLAELERKPIIDPGYTGFRSGAVTFDGVIEAETPTDAATALTTMVSESIAELADRFGLRLTPVNIEAEAEDTLAAA